MPSKIQPTRSNLGQVTLEAIVVIGFFLPIFAMVGSLLLLHMQRMECGYVAFEATHAKLHQRTYPVPRRVKIRFEETSTGVKGFASCGRFSSEVEVRQITEGFW